MKEIEKKLEGIIKQRESHTQWVEQTINKMANKLDKYEEFFKDLEARLVLIFGNYYIDQVRLSLGVKPNKEHYVSLCDGDGTVFESIDNQIMILNLEDYGIDLDSLIPLKFVEGEKELQAETFLTCIRIHYLDTQYLQTNIMNFPSKGEEFVSNLVFELKK